MVQTFRAKRQMIAWSNVNKMMMKFGFPSGKWGGHQRQKQVGLLLPTVMTSLLQGKIAMAQTMKHFSVQFEQLENTYLDPGDEGDSYLSDHPSP
jgi:hypothetical protein